MPTDLATQESFRYRRHEPEKTLLYRTLAREWERWHAERQADTSRSPLPEYVAREMDAYLRCGILDHGFLILSCEGCGEKLPVAFSCKRRGFCPSCCAKRMSEISVHLVDNVLPHAPFRQWVTTFPHPLRYWMAASRELTNTVHAEVARMIEIYYLDKAERRGVNKPVAGGVTFVQRFGSALNLNVHFHTVALDGVFSVAGKEPVFYQLPGPTDEEVPHLVEAVAHAVIKRLRAKDYVGAGEEATLNAACLDAVFQESEQLVAAVSASASMRIAFGPREGQRVRRIGHAFGYEGEPAQLLGKRCASANGFTLHANRYIGTKDRLGLERLLAYGARGSFSNQRLSLACPDDPGGDLTYSLKAPWRDGTEAILISPAETIEKLVALIPPPYGHLSRYFGVFASHSRWRRKIILRPDVKRGFVATPNGIIRMTWALLLARVFAPDIARCPSCGQPLEPDNFELVVEPALVHGILHALGLAGRAPARAPPRSIFDETDIDQSVSYAD
jgi:hypothetical protein